MKTPFLGLVLLTVSFLAAQERKPLSSDNLIQMKKAGLDDSTIIRAIEANGSNADTSAEGLIAMKAAGLSDRVITAAVGGTIRAPAQNSGAAPSTSIGVYVLQGDKLTPLPVELTALKTSGIFGAAATMGIMKGKVSGTLQGEKSSLQLSQPIQITIRTPDGIAPEEVQLVELEIKKDRREFTLGMSRMWTSSTGVTSISLKFEKTAENTYKVDISSLKRGEYGILAPMTASAAGGRGRIYTFGAN